MRRWLWWNFWALVVGYVFLRISDAAWPVPDDLPWWRPLIGGAALICAWEAMRALTKRGLSRRR